MALKKEKSKKINSHFILAVWVVVAFGWGYGMYYADYIWKNRPLPAQAEMVQVR